MHTLSSGQIRGGIFKSITLEALTDIVCFVEHHDGVFRQLFGYLIGDFGVQKVVKGIDNDVDERHLIWKKNGWLHHDIRGYIVFCGVRTILRMAK